MSIIKRLTLIGLTLFAVGCAAEPPEPAGPFEPAQITPAEVQARLAKGEKLVVADVRSKRSYSKEHIDGAVALPVAELSKDVKPGLPKDAWVVLYCT
ncbi:MAG: rhodanese-like domain-containing protein [Candidatus Sericytochromatia bacterium]